MENLIASTNYLIKNRRSIFPNMYSDERVDDQIIEQILENANWAPTHGLTEPWRFMVFCDEGLEKLGNFQAELYKEVSQREGDFNEGKMEKMRKKPSGASHVIAICMKRSVNSKIPEIEEIEAVACAVQNMYLTANAYGVGCYWTTGGVTYMQEAKPFFNLEEPDRLLGFLYVGIPNKDWPQGKRKPYQEKVNWVR